MTEEKKAEERMVLALKVAYNGALFSGFARQPGQLTVQGSLEEALTILFRREVATVCAGRTDSGVHARGQVVTFEVDTTEWEQRSTEKFLRSLNALTHEDIAILECTEHEPGFSARFDATLREYRYFICTDRPAPLLMRNFSWHLGQELDVCAMRKAARHLIGEHDFKSFCMAASAEGKSTSRNVFSIRIETDKLWGEHLVVVRIEGNAFLHSMVRTIVGTLVAVGLGKRRPRWVREVLAARDRSAAGENAPAQGLVFWRVSYEGERVHDARVAAEDNEEIQRSGAASFERFIRGDSLQEPVEESAAGHVAAPLRTRDAAVRAVVQAHERGRVRAARQHDRAFASLRDLARRSPEFVVPRGDGAHVPSGSSYTVVRDEDGIAYTPQSLLGEDAAPMRVVAEGGRFGEVLWEPLADAGIDEPKEPALPPKVRQEGYKIASASRVKGAVIVSTNEQAEFTAVAKPQPVANHAASVLDPVGESRFVRHGDYPFRQR